MSAWIEAQAQYALTSLEVLGQTQRALDEFVHEWRRESKLPVPVELDSLQRSLLLLIKCFRQSASASATHAANVARQLALLADFDEEKLCNGRLHGASLLDTAVRRIEKSLKVIAVELERMNERNEELRARLAAVTEADDTDENTREIFVQVAQSLDIVAYSYAPLDTRTVGAMSLDELKLCACGGSGNGSDGSELRLFADIRQYGEIDETKLGFEQLQRAFQTLGNFYI